MKTCEFAGDTFSEPRSHPWLGSITDASARYHDLRSSPQLIRSALEDFLPWARYGAIENFYALLERLNHRRSAFESNDCAFTGPHANDEPSVHKALSCTGRLMLLFHALAKNVAPAPLVSLKDSLHGELSAIDPDFQWGMVGTTLVPTRYLGLPEGDAQQLGMQLMISFWAWGDSEADTMLNLGRLFTNLGRALRTLSARAGA
jgi:hypothetical protein